MGLRYDLTLPLSRYYAANREQLPAPFKVIQTDRVYRAERPQKGRLREFVQCDIDILGDESHNAEVELPAILLKSVLLAIAAGWAAQRFGRISIPVLVGVVLTYQVVGTLGEWMYIGNFYNAIQDFRIGIPGMCLQVFGGYLFIRYLIRK